MMMGSANAIATEFVVRKVRSAAIKDPTSGSAQCQETVNRGRNESALFPSIVYFTTVNKVILIKLLSMHYTIIIRTAYMCKWMKVKNTTISYKIFKINII